MMQITPRSVALATLLCAGAAGPWIARAQTTTLPPMKSQGAVQYVCGGIGSDESNAMRAAMKDYPLSLLFARADGAYLAEVAVTIKDASGAAVLSMPASGPVCLITLPAGRYTVEAATEGIAKSHSVSVGRGSQTADFRF
ncbi:hypothetical protein H4CHR_00312 [Variovorax sp. PBS-H4]|uniref:carboxypeptidase regulatory-like domain-containing protein n=1 Tax=Variovorax sp. PBS-H4 TaxID=434008 RepID=UPI001316EE9E|nr:hypothetical protein H4CHR_00312 [Variovorax sp. PBS-H4]